MLRSDILAAAEELFVSEGYGNVSMRKIAARIEYSPTTIYRVFDSKAAIMHILIEDGYRRVRGQYAEVLRQSFESSFDALAAVLLAYVEFALANPNHYELWFATGSLDMDGETLRMRHGELAFSVYETWLQLIERCRSEGLFEGRDAMRVFQTVWSAVHGLISLRIRHPRLAWMPVADHVDDMFAMIEWGLARPNP